MESLADAGFFGGHYADTDRSSVIPTLFLGAMFVLAPLALRCLDLCGASPCSNDWIIGIAKSVSGRSPARDLPRVFLMQLLALFVMESAEQLAVGGKLLGGTIWLGGPVLYSLVAHALVGAGCLFALAAFMRGLLRTLASLVRVIVRFIWLAIVRSSNCFDFGRESTVLLRAQAAHVNHIGGRAPPLLHTPA